MTPERRDFIRREHARALTIIEAEGRRGRVTAHHRTEYQCEGCGFATTDAGTIFDHACPPNLDALVADVDVFRITTKEGTPYLFWRHKGGWDWLFITDPGEKQRLGDLSDVADFDLATLTPLAARKTE